MATSSFTKEFIISREEAEKLAEILEDNKETTKTEDKKKESEILYADEEFIKKCFV